MKSFLLYFCFTIIATLSVYGQQGKDYLHAYFIKDSIGVGAQVKYALVYSHHQSAQVIFPDTTSDFRPFEFIKKSFFTTVTNEDQSLDSAIYYLRCFDVQHDTLSLAMPIILLNTNGDSTIIYSNAATILFASTINKLDKTATLRTDTQLRMVEQAINYPLILLQILVVVIIFLLLFYAFRKTIIRRYRMYFLRKAHNSFIKLFDKISTNIYQTNNLLNLELLIGQWKVYLSKIEERPINSYTTTEIVNNYQNEELGNTLQYLDKCIYGNDTQKGFKEPLTMLKRFAIQRFQKKKKEVMNG